jgi:hypothetical protein
MTLKTKDILKILKLVKKNKKAKKRRSKHKKKINIITQQIAPSTLQPYEISRQPMTGTNNIQLDNLRLSNQVLENKLKEPDNNNNVKALEDKLNLAIGYNNLHNLTTSSISDIKNDNMELNNKLNRVIKFGKSFADDTKRKFDNHELKLESRNAIKQDNEEKPDLNLSGVFDDLDDHLDPNILKPIEPFSLDNPIHKETFSLDNPIHKVNPLSTFPFFLNKKKNITKVKVDEEKLDDLASPNVEHKDGEQIVEEKKDDSELVDEKPMKTFAFETIKGNSPLRKLLKTIETKDSRDLTADEITILKTFYKERNLKWASATKKTGSIKKQLQKL